MSHWPKRDPDDPAQRTPPSGADHYGSPTPTGYASPTFITTLPTVASRYLAGWNCATAKPAASRTASERPRRPAGQTCPVTEPRRPNAAWLEIIWRHDWGLDQNDRLHEQRICQLRDRTFRYRVACRARITRPEPPTLTIDATWAQATAISEGWCLVKRLRARLPTWKQQLTRHRPEDPPQWKARPRATPATCHAPSGTNQTQHARPARHHPTPHRSREKLTVSHHRGGDSSSYGGTVRE